MKTPLTFEQYEKQHGCNPPQDDADQNDVDPFAGEEYCTTEEMFAARSRRDSLMEGCDSILVDRPCPSELPDL